MSHLLRFLGALVFLQLAPVVTPAQDSTETDVSKLTIDQRLAVARDSLADGRRSSTDKLLQSVLVEDADNIEALYLKGHLGLLPGSEEVTEIIETLYDLNAGYEADILYLKLLLFLGDSRFEGFLNECRSKYPGDRELEYASWMYESDRYHRIPSPEELQRVSDGVISAHAPYHAAYCRANDLNDSLGLEYLDLLYEQVPWKFRAQHDKMAARAGSHTGSVDIDGELELEYADCTVQMGFYLIDRNGHKIKVSLDTGSGNRLFTIHHLDIGHELAGDTILVIEDGIWYNYMEEPVDVIMKSVDFSHPPVQALPVEYFDGGFSIADGCFSPFAFDGVAITLDPINETATMHDRRALEAYIADLPQDRSTIVPYVLRNSWPYVPCTVAGKEILMMVESGSRDVNFNKLAIRHLGLQPYDSVLIWRGKEYPTEMVDASIRVGDFEYEVKGGLAEDHVLGNHFYGMAGAGDIGPEFLKHFAFTFDPWERRLILVQPEGDRTETSPVTLN